MVASCLGGWEGLAISHINVPYDGSRSSAEVK